MGYLLANGGNGNSRNVSCSKPSLHCHKRPWVGALYKWLKRSASDAMHMCYISSEVHLHFTEGCSEEDEEDVEDSRSRSRNSRRSTPSRSVTVPNTQKLVGPKKVSGAFKKIARGCHGEEPKITEVSVLSFARTFLTTGADDDDDDDVCVIITMVIIIIFSRLRFIL